MCVGDVTLPRFDVYYLFYILSQLFIQIHTSGLGVPPFVSTHTVTALRILEYTLFAHHLYSFLFILFDFFFCLGGQKRACDCQGLHVCLSGCWKWLCSTALLVLFVYKVIAKKSPSLLVTVPRVCGPGCHFKCHEHSLGS